MASYPKVSVLIPAYNYGHLLDETIKSVLDQTYSDFELIIVDNASSDNTSEVVSGYLSDSRIKYFRNKTNIGLAGNWNRCLELANGEYIKFLCADDKFHPQILEKYVYVMDQRPEIAIISAQKQWFGEGVKPKVINIPFSGICDGIEAIGYTVSFNFNYIGEPSVPMFRRSNLIGEKFEQLDYVTDWEMWIRQLLKGSCYLIPEVLCYARRHNNQQQVLVRKQAKNHLEMYWLYKNLLDGKYGVFPEMKPDLEKMVKYYALKCAFNFYKLLPTFFGKTARNAGLELAKIAWREKVLMHPGIFTLLNEKIQDKQILIPYRKLTSLTPQNKTAKIAG